MMMACSCPFVLSVFPNISPPFIVCKIQIGLANPSRLQPHLILTLAMYPSHPGKQEIPTAMDQLEYGGSHHSICSLGEICEACVWKVTEQSGQKKKG